MRGNKVDLERIEEPNILVGNSVSVKDPKLGILSEGPYSEDGEPSLARMKVGIVGNSDTVGMVKKFLSTVERGIDSQKPEDLKNNPPFPKFTSDSTWNCEIVTKDRWNEELPNSEIQRTDEIEQDEERIGFMADRIGDNMRKIAKPQTSPDVIIVAIPDKVDENCGLKHQMRSDSFLEGRDEIKEVETGDQYDLFDFSEDDRLSRAFNLRRALKIKAMELDTPIQIIREETLTSNNRLSSKAWNLFSALHYKAGGVPWRMKNKDPHTVYIGISFYRDRKSSEEYLRTSIAQMFTPGGESLVLEGGNAVKDDKLPHLSKEQANNLLSNCVEKYREHKTNYPRRLVLHKRGPYEESELEGFKEALRDKVRKRDFVSIGPSKIRLLRNGRYPTPRGLIMKTPNQAHLYTTGYIPEKGTYPGSRIPTPLIIRLRETDKDYQKLASEILELSKLSWNNSNFCTREPITTEFSSKVGEVMSEMTDKGKMKDDFRYYM